MLKNASPQRFDAERAAAYDDRIRRLAPGYDLLQSTVASVLAARLPDDAHLLVVGAGTGAEIVTMGRNVSRWQFTAVDPSPDMLDRCRSRVAEAGLAPRVEYVCDRIEDASFPRRFDAATSLLVAHFIDGDAAKQRYFHALAEWLRPDAPLVWADLYRPTSDEAYRALWAAWREQTGARMEADAAARAFERIDEGISFVRPATLHQIVADAGLTPPVPLYQHLLWGAWMSTAA
ncbi:class I SAM-dependent methyltransferase [Salinibacter ruber]|uniref:class I SAM-dependent methyltransferase n=1 Tax=Salinibacter ruber TaxID=146919 RepID=UPI002072B60B|nr:class I SAM-dependent methyltransferase [Salinibacter ruber]MCS3649739.1 tRNA (cmo5U34)-methyltransferase [Salinibacter ruber]MCS3652993.1 tRNA (cmo5U34)-methyltransferase [Salinibacter ruber]MCS3757883.1 tRNA (cmo5U34)-methyltransferase [Salinibacter ruber]MCS3954537.1 tRNA (cmo5U34)-methyltransferase [Salinibacter ruber]MCS4086497.1 tRNA (cmo5U34)-methyltransferase [Salinibacter ruber]